MLCSQKVKKITNRLFRAFADFLSFPWPFCSLAFYNFMYIRCSKIWTCLLERVDYCSVLPPSQYSSVPWGPAELVLFSRWSFRVIYLDGLYRDRAEQHFQLNDFFSSFEPQRFLNRATIASRNVRLFSWLWLSAKRNNFECHRQARSQTFWRGGGSSAPSLPPFPSHLSFLPFPSPSFHSPALPPLPSRPPNAFWCNSRPRIC